MTKTDQNTLNQKIADAIVSIYREGPTEFEIRDLLAADVICRDWLQPDLETRDVDQFIENFVEKASKAFPDATEEVLETIFDGRTLMVNSILSATFADDFFGPFGYFRFCARRQFSGDPGFATGLAHSG